MKRNYSQLDQTLFQNRLEELRCEWVQPEIRDDATIDHEAQRCQDVIVKVLEELIPTRPIKISPRWVNWWTLELARMKHKLRRTYKHIQGRRPSQFIVDSYQRNFKRYKKLIRMAKRESWKRFCENTESTSEIARLAKIIHNHPKFSPGFLRDENGVMCASQEDMIEQGLL